MILFTIFLKLYARVALWGPTLYNDDVRVVFRAEQGYGGDGRMDDETCRPSHESKGMLLTSH